MKAVAATFDSQANKVVFKEIEAKPEQLGPHDILVEVRAVSLNPVDFKVAGGVKDAAGKILGYDASGIVKEVGTQVTSLKTGDEVYYAGSVKRQGNQAQLHTVD